MDENEVEALPVGAHADTPAARTFSLSLTIRRAAGLQQLLTTQALSETGKFWFSSSLFDVVVQTDQFDAAAIRAADSEAQTPAGQRSRLFEAVCDTFRVRATLTDLQQHLAEHSPLPVYLCTEQKIIAAAHITLDILHNTDDDAAVLSDIAQEQTLHLRAASQTQSEPAALERSTVPATVTMGLSLVQAEPSLAAAVCDKASSTQQQQHVTVGEQEGYDDDDFEHDEAAGDARGASSIAMPGAVSARIAALQLPASLRRGE